MPRVSDRAEDGQEKGIIMSFQCAICAEESTRICARCTKDTCVNHLCERCGRCSDCCDCEIALSEPVHEPVRAMLRNAAAMNPAVPDPAPQASEATPEPEPWHALKPERPPQADPWQALEPETASEPETAPEENPPDSPVT
jgi:hypothetical protein